MFDKLKCIFGFHNWIYQGPYHDGQTGIAFGDFYKCSKCPGRKWVTHDGRIYYR